MIFTMTLLIIASIALLLSVASIVVYKIKEGKTAKNGIPFTLSVVAIILAFIAVAVSLPRDVDKAVEMDYLGVIVGVLSFLITVLIGWQLYSVFRIKDDVQEANNAKESAKADLESINQSAEQAKQSAKEIKETADKFYQDAEIIKKSVFDASSDAKKTADEIGQMLDDLPLDNRGLKKLVRLIIGLTLSDATAAIEDPAEREKKIMEYTNKVMSILKE